MDLHHFRRLGRAFRFSISSENEERNAVEGGETNREIPVSRTINLEEFLMPSAIGDCIEVGESVIEMPEF